MGKIGHMLSVEVGGNVSNSKYHDEILRYITEHGESGVNALAKALDIPLSTMQKTLEQQTYFKKTERRKWDLPENVIADIKSDTMTLMVSSVENALLLVKAQLTDIQDSVQNSLIPINTLKRSINSIVTPVAAKPPNIDQRLLDLDKKVKDVRNVLKIHMENVPEEYKDLIVNLDILGLMIERGTEYLFNEAHNDLSALLTGQTDTLSDETLKMLESYQKEA